MGRVIGTLRATVAALALALAGPAPGQPAEDQQVALVADSVTYETATGRVIAEGAVEVFYGERTLTADRIVYDSRTDRISATGSIAVREPTGEVTLYADAAELDVRLRDGLVKGARSVIGNVGRLAAVEARRIDDRYNALSKAVFSPCRVCEADPTPTWRIRARRIIHDEQERTIHYENAYFDLWGQPVLWVPYFRHADPTVRRKSGFLTPFVSQSSVYGFGLRTPYYWVIDDHSDATIEPFYTTGDGPLLIGEYRRRFGFGDFSIRGSGTVDTYDEGEDRFHGNLQSLGAFETGSGIDYGFDIDVVTDNAYLSRYDFSDDDRLDSELFVRDYGERDFFDLAAVYFQSLRADEDQGQVPFVLPDFTGRYALPQAVAGGTLGFFADAATVVRTEGDDAARISLGTDWEREIVLPSGLALSPFAEARVDLSASGQNATFSEANDARLAPLAGVEARYPLIAEGANATHILEPIAQAIVAPYGGNDEIPNEDSLLTEFDETSLFERSHFPGLDAVEEGPRLNLGVRYERLSASGIDLDAVVGRVLRPEDADEFSEGSGLVNAASDWVGSWSASFLPFGTVRQRVRLSEELDLTRNEVYGSLEVDRVGLDLSYVFLAADPRIEAPRDREEISAAGRLRLTRAWSVGAYVQHNIERGTLVETGGNLVWQNDCLSVDLGIEQRFTEQDGAPEALAFGLEVRLLSLGTSVARDVEKGGGRCIGGGSRS